MTRLLALRAALRALTGRLLHRHSRVVPGRRVVDALVWVEPGEEPVEILGVLEALVDDYGRVRVVLDVLVEPALVLEDVVDDAAEEGDVRAGPDRDVRGRHRARARIARVDVHDLCTLAPR